ncbi:MAG: homoserine dehydrogenase [Anaerolineales bacterium]
MTHYPLAFFGFGSVGRALARLLLRKQSVLQADYGITFSVVAIRTGAHGSAINPAGIALETALQIAESQGNFSTLSALPIPAEPAEFLRVSGARVLFENTPVNYQTGEPAVSHLRAALTQGIHAITANKGPVVHAYHALKALATQHGAQFYFESTVMDGCPVFSLFRGSLPAANLLRFKAVLNSTTNLILSRMESGESFDDAVGYAQSIGIAETDPSGDIDGWDAAIKVSALATVLMDLPLQPAQVDRTGIRDITPQMVAHAKANGTRYKLICTAERTANGIAARVAPELVTVDSPFYGVQGTTSLAQFETDVLGKLTLIEEDPGPHTTAYGLLADFINAVTGK